MLRVGIFWCNRILSLILVIEALRLMLRMVTSMLRFGIFCRVLLGLANMLMILRVFFWVSEICRRSRKSVLFFISATCVMCFFFWVEWVRMGVLIVIRIYRFLIVLCVGMVLVSEVLMDCLSWLGVGMGFGWGLYC